MKTEPITKDEWRRFDWMPTQDKTIFIKGVEQTQPPDDGYYYVEVTSFSDAKQQWARAQKIVET